MNGSVSPVSAVRLTAPGRGAVASVRLRFDSLDQVTAIDSAFTAANGMDTSDVPVNRVLFGSWRGEDVVLVRTAELEWEVHCHGGEVAIARILSEFDADAASAAETSPLEAVLLRTRTPKTARLALAQANGCLKDTLQAAADCESESDFHDRLERLLTWTPVAQHLDEPWRVVIAGPPNVGKSSLLNAIAGYERAIVFDQPGTTRDALQTELVINGWPFCLVDTAGIRGESDDPIERDGILHAHRLLAAADLVLVAVDCSAGWLTDHHELLSRIPEATPRAVVVCKNDLKPHGDSVPNTPGAVSAPVSGRLGWGSQRSGAAGCGRTGDSLHSTPATRPLDVLFTSAAENKGIAELTQWISSQLIPTEPTLETALPVAGSADLCRSLLRQLDKGANLETVQNKILNWLKNTRSGLTE